MNPLMPMVLRCFAHLLRKEENRAEVRLQLLELADEMAKEQQAPRHIVVKGPKGPRISVKPRVPRLPRYK